MAAKKKLKKNDPCPCGSGKKYRDCCGIEENRIKLEDVDSSELEMAFDRMLDLQDELWCYLENMPQFSEYYEEAMGKFEEVLTEDGLDFIDMYEEVFQDWFCFDFIPEGTSHSLASQYLWGGKPRVEERKILQAMMDSHMGLYRVVKKENEICLLEDLFAGQLHITYAGELEEGKEISVGDFLAVRLFKLKEGYLLSTWEWTVDPEQIEAIVADLLEMMDASKYRDMKLFLKQNSLQLIEMLVGLTEALGLPPVPTRILFIPSTVELTEKLQGESSFEQIAYAAGLTVYHWNSDIRCPNILLIEGQLVILMSYDEEDLEYGAMLLESWDLDTIPDQPIQLTETEPMNIFILKFVSECLLYDTIYNQIEAELGMSAPEAVQDPWGRYQIEKILTRISYAEADSIGNLRQDDSQENRETFLESARYWLGIGTMEEDQAFMLVPRVIKDMVEWGRVDSRICIDPDRFYWSQAEYAGVGQLIFERLEGRVDELSLNLLLHAWDEYSGIYLPVLDEPAGPAAALVLAFSSRLGDGVEPLQYFPEIQDYEAVRQLAQAIKQHFILHPLGPDDMDDHLSWEEMELDEQAVEVMEVCGILAQYAVGESGSAENEHSRQIFLDYVQAGPVPIELQSKKAQLDLTILAEEWLAINVHEDGRVSYLEQYQSRHSNRLTAVEKQALTIIADSQLRWLKVQAVVRDGADGCLIDTLDLESGNHEQLLWFDFMEDESDIEDQVIFLRTFKLKGINVAMETMLGGRF